MLPAEPTTAPARPRPAATPASAPEPPPRGSRGEPEVATSQIRASVATRIALATGASLALVCALVVVQLTSTERSRLVSAKTGAAAMVADLFAASIAPALDFKDDAAIADGLAALKKNPEVIYASVWADGAESASGESGKDESGAAKAPPPRDAATLVSTADAAGDYADALGRALEVGLEVPRHS